MEVEAFQECWKEESVNFYKEEFYESIQAPKWIDFTLPRPEEPDTDDDNVWFCLRAGCDQKHGTLLEETPNHSYLLKSQASKSVTCISKLSTMEGKSSVRPRLRAPLSAPTLKGRDKTPGKAKPPGMSASKFRQKQLGENEDPNSTNIGILNLKMDDAEGHSTPNPSSNIDGVDSLEENLTPSDVNLTPQNQTIKSTGAFSTPRMKKNHSVKPEPFRSNPALSKGMNNTSRSKAITPRSLLFQTPTKSVKKTPSEDLTPVTKHCTNPTKRVQFAANDHKYSSPSKVSPKKCFAICNIHPSESPLSRNHNFPSASRPKDSRSATSRSPSSHRKVLFSGRKNEKETLLRANVQKMDLVEGKVGSCVENDTAKCLSGNNYKEQLCQVSKRDSDMSLQDQCEEQQDATFAHANVRICGSDVIKSESEHDILDRGKDGRDRSIHEDGGCIRNQLSIKQQQAGNNEQKPAYTGDDSKGTSPKETMRKASGKEQQYETQLASIIAGEGLTYEVSEINIHKASDSYDSEKLTSDQDETNVPNKIFAGLQQFFETFPKEIENNNENDSDGKAEITILEGGEDEDRSKFDVVADDRNLEGIDNKVVMISAAEDRGAREMALIKKKFASESESNLQNDSKASFLNDGENDGQDVLNVEPNDKILIEKAKVVVGSAAETGEAREETSIQIQFASKSESKERNQEEKSSRDLKNELVMECYDRNIKGSANKCVMDSAAENRETGEESSIRIWFASESESNLENDSDGKVEIVILKDGKNDDESTLNVKPTDRSPQERLNKGMMDSASKSAFNGRNMVTTESTDLKGELDMKPNGRNLEEEANKVVMNSAAEKRGVAEENSIIIQLGSGSESDLQIDSNGKAQIAFLEDGQHNDRNPEERDNGIVMDSGPENKIVREETSIKFQFASEVKSNLQNDFDGKADITILTDGRNNALNALDVEPSDHHLEERENTVGMDSSAENGGAREDSTKNKYASESECKDKHIEGKAVRALKSDIDIESDNIIMEKAGEVLKYSDDRNERAIQETGIVVQPSEVGSEARHVEKRDDFYLKNKKNSVENEDHAAFEQELVIRGAKEGKSGEGIQLEFDSASQSKIMQNDMSSDSGECLQVTVNVAIKYVKEDIGDSMQKINTDEGGRNADLSWHSQCFDQDLRDAAKVFLKPTIGPEPKQCNELKDSTVEVDISDTSSNFSKVNHLSHAVGNEKIESDFWISAHQSETVQEDHHEGFNCTDGGHECDEHPIIPQSKPDKTSQLLVSDASSSDVVCEFPKDYDETPQMFELKENNEIGLPARDCFPHSTSDGAVQDFAVAGCIVHVIPEGTRGDEQKEMHHESGKKESPFTPSKGKKRSSGEMDSKTNCSNGELCQDESCSMAFFSCHSAPPAKVKGVSARHAIKHKKIKPTLPRPFRLRTAERGERKEAGLNKKTQQFEAEKESSPMREKRANRAQEKHSHIKPLKCGKPERPKPLEDKGEEIKSIPMLQQSNRPTMKMPNFLKPPFKPMRSTKKLTTPQEPNFHRMHTKKDCNIKE